MVLACAVSAHKHYVHLWCLCPNQWQRSGNHVFATSTILSLCLYSCVYLLVPQSIPRIFLSIYIYVPSTSVAYLSFRRFVDNVHRTCPWNWRYTQTHITLCLSAKTIIFSYIYTLVFCIFGDSLRKFLDSIAFSISSIIL